jgi:hypothetical protein
MLIGYPIPEAFLTYKLLAASSLAGGFGGIVYCLRGVYLNACVHKRWDKDWAPWYFIRPVVSLIMGGVSFVILKAGLLVLEASPDGGSTHFGFLVVAFVAGLNVDRFLEKVEDIAQSMWGIQKSRVAQNSKKEQPNP